MNESTGTITKAEACLLTLWDALPSDRFSALEMLESLSIEQLDELYGRCLALLVAAHFARHEAPPIADVALKSTSPVASY